VDLWRINMSKRAIRNSMIGIVIIAVIIILCVIYIPGGSGSQAALPKAVTINTKDQPVLGNKDAKLNIVAFEDLKCSNCMRYNVTVFPKIFNQYIQPGKANYTMITLAFIPGSMPAANAGRCIYDQNPNAYWNYVKYVYAHQPPENQNWATIPNLMLIASHLKEVNSDKLAQCLVKSPYTETINNNLKILKGIMKPPVGTPAVYINGVKVEPLTIERFQHIASELS
jgi:protein-disulfide isomerase